MVITLTLHLFAPGLQMSKAGEVVMKLTFKQLPIALTNKTSVNTLFGYIDSENP
jgi:hypothetical protein